MRPLSAFMNAVIAMRGPSAIKAAIEATFKRPRCEREIIPRLSESSGTSVSVYEKYRTAADYRLYHHVYKL